MNIKNYFLKDGIKGITFLLSQFFILFLSKTLKLSVMKNQFFIKKGSFCFIIPFFTENSSVCNQYFNKLKENIEKLEKTETDENSKRGKRKKIIKYLKENFINEIKKETDYFTNIKPNFHTKFCRIRPGEDKYNGRFLCKCMSSAIKFHDDISQQKNAVQFF